MMILSILTEQMQLNLFKIIQRIIMFSSFVLMLLSPTMLIQAGRVEIEVNRPAGFIYLQDVLSNIIHFPLSLYKLYAI